MDNYINNTTSRQYYYINGKYILIPSKDVKTVNFGSNSQYNNYNYFSNDNNLYNINTNLNTNIIYNNYNYKPNQIQVNMYQNNNSLKNYQNNYALVTPINTRQNPFKNLNSAYSTKHIPSQNLSNNIDNNSGININNSSNYNSISNQNKNVLSNGSNISNDKTEEKEKIEPDNIKIGYDPILLDKKNATEAVLNKIMKEESGDFLCPKCGHRLFGDHLANGLEKWISRENNGINKIIFYAKDFMGYPEFYGRMEEKYYPEYNDSDDSCGVKRSIHIDAHTELQYNQNYSYEYCWKDAFTDKEWNKYLDNIMCLFCDYKSNFLDFIKDKKKQAKNK